MVFSQRLMESRKKKNLTQNELSKKLGITRSTYANYETCKREPAYDVLYRISKELNVSIDWLLGRTNIPEEKEKLELNEYFLSQLSSYFNNDNVSEQEKETLMLNINNIFWKSKHKDN